MEYTDIKESQDGDLVIRGGDIEDTSENSFDGIVQIIRTLLNTPPDDFQIYSNFGIDLDVYSDRSNSESLGNEIADVIKYSIISQTSMPISSISVNPYPIGKHTIVCDITIGGFNNRETVIKAAYDTKESKLESIYYEG